MQRRPLRSQPLSALLTREQTQDDDLTVTTTYQQYQTRVDRHTLTLCGDHGKTHTAQVILYDPLL